MKSCSYFLFFLAMPALILADAPKPNGLPVVGGVSAPGVVAPNGNPVAAAPVVAASSPTPVVDMANAPEIVCPHPNFDFGTVDEGPDITHEFHFRNKGKGTLKISNVGTSCGCTAAVAGDKEVPPGGKSVIKATYHTNGRPGHATKIITVTSNDPKNPQYQMKLDMTVARDIDVQPDRIYLYNIHHGQAKDTPVTILGKAGMKFHIISAEITSTAKVVSVTTPVEVTDDKDGRKGGTFTVSLPATQPIGAFTDEITVKTDSKKKPTITIPVLGEIVGKIQFNPKQFTFQPHQETPVTVTFNVENPKTFVIRRVETEKHLVRAYVEKNQNYGGDQYTVVIKPAGNLPADSDGKDKVTVWTNDDEQKSVTIDIQVNK